MDRGPAPKGLENSAQGFNPGNPQNKWFALMKGREMRVPDEARACRRAKVRVRNWDVRQLDRRTRFRLLGRSIWRLLQGAPLLADDSQG
jgi:hypothetical protein